MSAPLAVAADGLTILLAVAALVATFARRDDRARNRLLALAVRSLSRRSPVHDSDPLGLEDARRRSALIADLVAAIDQITFDAADVLAAALERTEDQTCPTERVAVTRQLLTVARGLREAGSFGLVARALYPAETAGVRHAAGRLAAHLARFEGAQAVAPARQHLAFPPTGSSFGAFASRMSGAPLLACATANKARLAATTLVWHNRRYRGLADGGRPTLTTSSFDAAHPGGQACEAWRPRTEGPGPFDQRLLDVRGVELVESHTKGFTAIVLHTAETCYAVSELGESVGCKKIPAEDIATLPTIELTADRMVRLDSPDRVVILTSYAAAITRDDRLLLAHRSAQNANGNDVLSATTGGVMTQDEPGHAGDVDGFGMPSPAVGLAREAREEIGLDLAPEHFHPVCVFLANVRGRPADEAHRGQVVACVLHLATVDALHEEVLGWMATRSDLAHGRFEQRDLVPVDTTSAEALARFAAERATDLDQHGLLSCLMTAAVLHGEEATMEAFTAAFEHRGGSGTSTWAEVSPWPTGLPRTLADIDHFELGSRL